MALRELDSEGGRWTELT